MVDTTVFRRKVTVLSEHGLHIRPCQILAQRAQQFQCQVRLLQDGRTVDAKSVFDILTLAAESGAMLDLETEGADAPQALQEVGDLFDQGFQLTAVIQPGAS
jgi:phosphocarrier protein HPr